MPVYEYECPECLKVFEVQQKMTEKPLSDCPDCGGAVKKIISMSSFQLKGGGWYADGYSCSSGGSKEKSASPCQGGACQSCPASS